MNISPDKFKTLWEKRGRKNEHKIWQGDDPIPAFDYKNPNKDARFSDENWNDLAINDFRELLDTLQNSEAGDLSSFRSLIPIRKFVLVYKNHELKLGSVNKITNPIDIIYTYDERHDTNLFEIRYYPRFTRAIFTYHVSIYKSRGNIESFTNSSQQNITLGDLTEILFALDLEK